MFIKTTLIALTLAVSAAPMAFAKGHSQSINGPYHGNVAETVEDAKTLGSVMGKGRQ